jgi:hypothetical protein
MMPDPSDYYDEATGLNTRKNNEQANKDTDR